MTEHLLSLRKEKMRSSGKLPSSRRALATVIEEVLGESVLIVTPVDDLKKGRKKTEQRFFWRLAIIILCTLQANLVAHV